MKIFISWSGELSQAVALTLRSWLQNVIQFVEPYVSSEDIEKGSRWFADIDKKLDESDFGIVCLTRENINKPWILFETGAISRAIDRSRVTPLLINLSPADLNGPLAQFQATTISEVDIRRLIKNINSHLSSPKFNEALVERAFLKWWPDLQKEVNDLLNSANEKETEVVIRSERSILEELLQTTRTLSQLISSSKSEILVLPSNTSFVMEQIKVELERRRKPFLVVALSGASKTSINEDEFYIEFAPEGKHLHDSMVKPDNAKILRDVCSRVMGRNVSVRFVVRDGGAGEDDF